MEAHEESLLCSESSMGSSIPAGSPWRRLRDISTKEIFFYLSTAIFMSVIVIITVVAMAAVESSHPDFKFGFVVLISAGFSMVYITYGTLTSRASAMFVLSLVMAFTVALLIGNYVAGNNIIEDKNKHTAGTGNKHANLGRLVVACLISPFLIVIGLYIAWQYHVEKRLVRLVVGDNDFWQQMYTYLLLFQDFIKLDLQYSVMMITFTATVHMYPFDIVSMAFGYPFVLAYTGLGLYSIQKEKFTSTYIFFGLTVFGAGYCIYGFTVVKSYIEDDPGLAWAALGCAIAFVAVRGTMMFLAIRLYRGFGSGMKEMIN